MALAFFQCILDFCCLLDTIYGNADYDIQELLKFVSTIFYQNLIFHQMMALQKLKKIIFITSKKLFSFLRYSNFCIFAFPYFFPCQPLLCRLIQEKP